MKNILYIATNQNGETHIFSNKPHRVISNTGRGFWQDGNSFGTYIDKGITSWMEEPKEIDLEKFNDFYKKQTKK